MAQTFVIFGASGDLTSRKLIPALYQLYRKKRVVGEALNIVGFSRTKFTHDQWRASLEETTRTFAGESFDPEIWEAFAKHIYYHPGDIGDVEDFKTLHEFLYKIEKGVASVRVYYLSTAPRFYQPAIAHLGAAGLADERNGQRNVIIEKPFGTSLKTALALNTFVHQNFKESQVYRIDHYLGKETVQNLMVLRFANTMFEPVWNRNYIDHVQITVAEEVDVARRGGYYDSAGVVRDMFQNHLLQLLMVSAMESPSQYTADAVRDEKVKVLRAVRQLSPEEIAKDTVRGQYLGYLDHEGVPENSPTETFAAIKLQIDNWRWQGVPFYLRTGKALSCRSSQIVIQFREPPHMLFPKGPQSAREGNRLVIQVQPAEGIQLHFETKVPDAGMTMRQTELDFNYQREFKGTMPEAYERLLLDAIEGDASLFARADEVEAAWKICDPILDAWRTEKAPPLYQYESGFWGPTECAEWMYNQDRQWFDTCPILH